MTSLVREIEGILGPNITKAGVDKTPERKAIYRLAEELEKLKLLIVELDERTIGSAQYGGFKNR